jgi:hypothetical protein
VPGIHVQALRKPKDVDGRNKPGHDKRRHRFGVSHFSFGMIDFTVAISAGGV